MYLAFYTIVTHHVAMYVTHSQYRDSVLSYHVANIPQILVYARKELTSGHPKLLGSLNG